MKKEKVGMAAAAVLLAALGSAAEPERTANPYAEAATPGPPHAGLAAAVGSYDLKVRSWAEPGAPPTEVTGTATRSMILQGRVLVEDVKSPASKPSFLGHGMTGFDNVTGMYWSTWNDTMGTGLMVSSGTCDGSRTCSFQGSWNDPVSKAPIVARMVSRWVGDKEQVFEMYGPGKDGKETKMMEIRYLKK